MRAVDIIQKKRDGEELSETEVQFLINRYTSGDVPDYQMAAFAMAVFFKSMTAQELAYFTQAMLHSGTSLDLSHLSQVAVDKHATGGVGDKISIPLAPAVAACGVAVPMISGRGLAHTGGTLDKLESIPGFNVNLPQSAFLPQLDKIGCFLIGQTAEIAPADKKLYALRDVTATVDCIPLIASSIMSKKLAEGIKGLVLDVKWGSGAMLPELSEATKLARTMVDIGKHMGKDTVARLTSMEQPVGTMVGNTLEIIESLDILQGKGPADTKELVIEFGAEMLVLGKVSSDLSDGRRRISETLENGKALAKFAQIIEAQGGDARIVEDRSLLGRSKSQIPFKAKRSGYVEGMNTRLLGIAAMVLGAGRQKVTDSVDPHVGFEVHTRIGDEVKEGQTLFVLHSNGNGEAEANALISRAITIGDKKTPPPDLFGPRII